MKTLFLVNSPDDLSDTPTTAALVHAQAARGPTFVAGCTDLGVGLHGVTIRARRIAADGSRSPVASVSHDAFDVVYPRMNPVSQRSAWGWEHALTCLRRVEDLGVPVRNSPDTLARFAAKPGLLQLSDHVRPPTVVSGTVALAREAIAAFGRSVAKPAHGSQGKGVFIVDPTSANLEATLDLLLDGGPIVVQPWLPAAVQGDVRVFVADGTVFSLDGKVAAIRRRPAKGELRSNIHLGGSAEAVTLEPEVRELADRAAAELLAQGVRFAGIDCIGNRLVEVNVCAPGGLPDMSNRYGVDFVGGWLDCLARPITAR